jgi:hypothetical protein
MSLKDRIKARIKADGLFGQLISTIKEPPGIRRLDKDLARQLLAMTDFQYKKLGGLDLYVRPLNGMIMEIAVFDNELPIYQSTESDVALRKAPYWQEMFSVKNVKKIMNHHDILASTGRESLKRIYEIVLSLIDLTYTQTDLTTLLDEAYRGLDRRSASQIRESLDLFFVLLDFKPVSLGVLPKRALLFFAGPKEEKNGMPLWKDLVIFNEETLQLGLRKGEFSQERKHDLAWVTDYAKGVKKADLQGGEVFSFLHQSALAAAKVG